MLQILTEHGIRLLFSERALLCTELGGVNLQDSHGRTALHVAAFTGTYDCIEWLLEIGAEADIQDGNGETALFKAAMTGSSDCVQLLLDKDANPTIQYVYNLLVL